MTADSIVIQSRAKGAVLKLLAAGEITCTEAAWAIGVSRQCVHNWMKAEGVDRSGAARWDHVKQVVARECANAVTA